MKTFIIAEAGVNHNGSITLAKKLIDAASNCGVDAIKFQSFKAKNLAIKNLKKTGYQKKSTNKKETQFEMLKKLEMSEIMHLELINYCKKKKIEFLSSPFDSESIDLLKKLGLKTFKIPSGEITNLPYLRKIGKLKKKIILSTGMSTLYEIKNALNVLVKSGTSKDKITVLHANTDYPTKFEDVNLNAMITIGRYFDLKFGYSDHTLGIEVGIAAVAMGASCIEKHFTLNCNMKGPDHKASLEPLQFDRMVKSIRNIEVALGSKIKKPGKSEKKNMRLVRKSIVANANIKKGELLSKINLAVKRPGTGISPMRWDEIIGTYAPRNYKKDELI